MKTRTTMMEPMVKPIRLQKVLPFNIHLLFPVNKACLIYFKIFIDYKVIVILINSFAGSVFTLKYKFC